MLATTKPRAWLPGLAFFVALLAIGTTGFLLFKHHAFEMERTAQDGLAAVADLKVQLTVRWQGEQRKDAEAISRDNLLTDEVERWFQQGAPQGVLAQKILARLASVRQVNQYESVTLLDGKARLRLRAGGGQKLDSHDTNFALQALRENKVTRSDIHWSADQKPEMDMVAPLAVPGTPGPRVIGAVYFRIDPDAFFFPFIQSWPTTSPSGETLLVRRDGNDVLFLNELRHRKGIPLKLRLPIDQPLLPAAMGLRGQIGFVEGMDYRDVPVVAVTRKVADTPWVLVAKLDRAEVNASLRGPAATAGGLTVLFMVLSGVIATLWWRNQHARYLAMLSEEKIQRQALEQHFDYATKHARDIILLFDETGRVVECNEAAPAAYGYTRDELLKLTLSELRAAQAVAAMPGDLERAALAGGVTFETVHRRKDGSTFPAETSMRRIEIEGRWFYQSIVRDITKRRQAEATLRESEERYRLVAEAASDVIVVIDEDSRIKFVNPASENVFGYSADEMVGNSLTLLIPEDLQPAHREGLKRYIDTGQRTLDWKLVELRARHKTGKDVPVEISFGEYLRDGKRVFMGIIRDISERKQAELSLQREAMRHKALMETAIDGIHIVDQNACLVEANPAFLRMLGYEKDEAIGLHVTDWDVHVSREEISASFGSLQTRGKIFETQWRCKDGSLRDVELSVSALKNEDVAWFYCAARDITDRKRTESVLRENEEQFRGLVEQSIAGIIIIDNDRFKYVNPRLAEIFGYAPEELIGQPATMILAEEDYALFTEAVRKRRSGNTESIAYTFTGKRKDGSIISVGASGTLATIEGRPVIIGLVQDISERERDRRQIEGYVYQLQEAMLGTVQAISTIVELRDPYTAGHEKRVGALARTIGIELGLPEEICRGLEITGTVHDIGKVAVPAEILSKPGRLTTMEFDIIKTHAQLGYDVMKDVAFPWPLAEAILQHHERLDGSGYPSGLKGDQIILEARIMAVADVVEAIASHRPYRATLGIDAALGEITKFRGVRYDPQVVDACLRLFREKGYRLPEQ